MPRPLGPPTAQQRAVLAFIAGFIAREQCAPTIREICTGLGFTSTNHGADVLRALERRELIFRPHDKRARQLRVTDAGRAVLATPEAA